MTKNSLNKNQTVMKEKLVLLVMVLKIETIFVIFNHCELLVKILKFRRRPSKGFFWQYR